MHAVYGYITCIIVTACGNGSSQVESSSDNTTQPDSSNTVSEAVATEANSEPDTRNQEIILDEPITIIDNDNVTIQVTRFFREVYNEGKGDEFYSAGFDIEADNKMDGYNIQYPKP